MVLSEERLYDPMPQFSLTDLYVDAEIALSTAGALLMFAVHFVIGEEAKEKVQLLDRPISETKLGEALANLYCYAFGGIWKAGLPLTIGGHDQLEVLVEQTRFQDMARQEDCAVLIHRLIAMVQARAVLDSAIQERDEVEYPGADSPLTYVGLALLSNLAIRTLRNRVSSKKFPVKTTKIGRELSFKPDQAQDWLVSRAEFVPTVWLDEAEYQAKRSAYLATWLRPKNRTIGGGK